jgi:peptidyl-prolyl cis-trans isomerase A (cyclophilin A)
MTTPVNRCAPGGARAGASLALVLLAAAIPACKCSSEKKPAASAEALYATIETSRGTIGVRLLDAEAPNTVANFVELATGQKAFKDPLTGQQHAAPFYDGLLFHRVVPGVMIQGGDPASRDAPLGADNQAGYNFGWTEPGFSIEDELPAIGTKLYEKPCMMGMANHGPNTGSSQFFLTEAAGLDQLEARACQKAKSGVCGFTRFGEGVCGCEVIPAISSAGNSQTRIVKVTIGKTQPTCK